MEAEGLELNLSSGRLAGSSVGPDDGQLVLCLHGLSANQHAFGVLASYLASPDRRVVAVDLRGRGSSEITPPGTYGLEAHARDALEIADVLGADRLHLVGWSLGALIGLVVSGLAPERLLSLTLLDHAGEMDPGAVEAVRAGLARLDVVMPDEGAYIDAIRSAGSVQPWHEMWDRFYAYELGPGEGGLTPATDRAACQEDLDELERDIGERMRALWPGVRCPALLVRCTVPLNGGLIVPEHALAEVREAMGDLDVVEVDRNHFGVMTDERTCEAVEALLARAG